MSDDLVERTVSGFGKLDILVSNAAHQNRKQSLADITDEESLVKVRTYKQQMKAAVKASESEERPAGL